MELEEIYYCPDCSTYYSEGESYQLHSHVHPQHHIVLLKDFIKSTAVGSRFEYVSPFFEPDSDNSVCEKGLKMMTEEENKAPKRVTDFVAYLNMKNYNPPILDYISQHFQPETSPLPEKSDPPKSKFGKRLLDQFNRLKRSSMNQDWDILEVTNFAKFLSEIRNEMTDRKQILDERHKSCCQKLENSGSENIDKFMKTLFDVEGKLKELQDDVDLYNSIQTEFKKSTAYTKTIKFMSSHLKDRDEDDNRVKDNKDS